MSEEQLMTTTLPCQVHIARHIPNSHVNHRHHIWPLGYDGPDVPENIVVVCPTGHANIHKLLDLFIRTSGEIGYNTLKAWSVQERHYAKLGWERICRQAL